MSKDDWDIDERTDDFYCESETYGYSRGSSSGTGNGILMIPIYMICTFSGIVIQALIYMMLGIEVKDVPAVVILLLWFLFSTLFSAVLGYVYTRIRKR